VRRSWGHDGRADEIDEIKGPASSLVGWVGEDGPVVASFAGDSAVCHEEVKSCLMTDAKSSDLMRLCRRFVLVAAELGDAVDGEEFGRLLGEVAGVANPDRGERGEKR
jgi:hypothetical protein